ncbi:MAG: hypothetical protein ACYCYP_02825 [Leptospirales bacterium]
MSIEDPKPDDSSSQGGGSLEDLPGQEEIKCHGYVPGVCNIGFKGRLLRGIGALVGFVAVILYNEKRDFLLVHPFLYFLGMTFLAFLTALSFIQSFLSFCVVDAFLGRAMIAGHFSKVSAPDHEKDRRRALLVVVGSFLLGAFFSALLLVEELDRSTR